MGVTESFAQGFQTLDMRLLIVVVVFIALDFITGYAQAAANHDVSSSIMRQGFWHKMAELFALVVAALLDAAASIETAVETGIGINGVIFGGACVYLIWMELNSILENLKLMNPELANSKLFSLFGTGGKVNDDGSEAEK